MKDICKLITAMCNFILDIRKFITDI